MNELYYFLAGVVATAVAILIVILLTNKRGFDGELQIYDTADGIYPVLAVKSERIFSNKIVVLKVRHAVAEPIPDDEGSRK